ncbi:MAG: hypothetical protein E7553_03860 [Ruminococcaceae bacterium]|nr:hypothetical protein [Oscillospiraceae bacterium]
MWIVCLAISTLFLLLIPAVILVNRAKERKKPCTQRKAVGWVYILLAGVALSSVAMFFPIHAVQAGLMRETVGSLEPLTVIGSILRALALSIFSTLQIFTAGAEFELVREGTACLQGCLAQYHGFVASLLYMVAPVFTFGAVLSLFKNAISYLRYYVIGRGKELYVFTEMNDRAMTLAEDIREKKPRSMIVFTDVYEENSENNYELLDRARALHAICFKKDVLALRFDRHRRSKEMYFFAIGANETENCSQAVKLIERYRHREKTNLYVFSKGVEGELMLNAADKGVMRVRRVNEVQSLISRLLYEEGEELFRFDKPAINEFGEKRICALIVGMGAHGTEMLKALSWYGQMDGYALELHGFDRDPMAEDRFTVQAPELMSKRYNGVRIEGEAQYTIRVHAGTDVQSVAFAKTIESLPHTSYVLVALGNDELNIQTAVYLRMLFERMRVHPVICAIVRNSQQKEALGGIKNFRKQPYDIRFIGDLKSGFSAAAILHSDLEEDALARHLKWGNEDEFWAYEYNYRSSAASAIHMKARIACGVPGADKAEEALSQKERDAIEALEHRRWNAYMRAEGYVYSGSKESSSRNDLGKMHHNLVNYEELSEEDKRKDSAVGTQ